VPPEPGHPAGLCRRVAEICADASFAETHLQDQLISIRRRLAEPLRIALTGRVSAGKSTMTNALLGTRIAPVGRGETTALVSHFADGEVESVMLVLRDGDREEIYLDPAGRLPHELPRPAEAVDHIEVQIPYAPMLRSATIIDTPGISSARPEGSGRTVEFLFSEDSRRAAAGADALLFLLRGHADEAEALAAFQDLAGTSSACCVNAIGVISQADKLGDREDPMGAARRVAQRLSNEPALRARLATVTPLLALIAETVVTGGFTAAEEGALAALATESEATLEDLLASPEDLVDGHCGVPRAARERLLEKLDVFGVRASVRAIQQGLEPSGLADFLYELSGLPVLKSQIAELFTRRADVLKADQALSSFERLTYQSTDESSLAFRARVEELRLSPAMHPLREMGAVSQYAQGRVDDLPEWLVERLLLVTRQTTFTAQLGLAPDAGADAVTAAATLGSTLCRTYSNVNAPSVRHRAIADTLRRSYELMLIGSLAADRSAVCIATSPGASC
jgi:hypothetical protein